MANRHGDFIWYELLTSDADAAQGFYGTLLEWRFSDSGQTGVDYRIISTVEGGVGGMMQLTPEMLADGARPGWLGYIAVDDVDRSVEDVVDAGGEILMPAMDISEVGRLAMVADPQGAPFYVMTPTGDGESLAYAKHTPMIGHCAWNELVTSDQVAAWEFYGTWFGWVKGDAMDMGEMGTYDFIQHDGMLGAMMTGSAEMAPPHWNQYFRVEDIDRAVEAIEAGGGRLVDRPMEIPGGDFALHALDPQGAAFGLVGPRTS